MRAKEKLIATANNLTYAKELEKIITDLLPLRLDKEATEKYYNDVLTPDIHKQNYKLQVKMHESQNAMQLDEPEEEHFIEELPIDKSKNIRRELLSIIADDLSFGYLFYLLGTEYNANNNTSPIDCIPDKNRIQDAISLYHDDYPKDNLDDYLEDEFNYEQYDKIIGNHLNDAQIILNVFNESYKIFDELRCRKHKVSFICKYLKEIEFTTEQEEFIILSVVKNLFLKFEHQDNDTLHCTREIERIIVPLQEKYTQKVSQKGALSSKVFLNSQKGKKLDIIRVITTLYDLDFFKDENQNKISKKEVFETIGKFLNIDLSKYQNDLSRSLTDSTALEKHLKIFEDMKDKMEWIFNSR